ncbi:MAG: acyl carrier protein [Spirochaetes bacterium]|nr:acyl carrier protein [Spirochaetota bacterium]
MGNNIQSYDINKEIVEIVSKVTRIDKHSILKENLIREELGIDSLMSIEIIANVEKQLNIAIDESKMSNINTVGDFIKFVELIMDSK